MREIVHALFENGSRGGRSEAVDNCHLWHLFLNRMSKVYSSIYAFFL